jgi:hypothetical protein
MFIQQTCLVQDDNKVGLPLFHVVTTYCLEWTITGILGVVTFKIFSFSREAEFKAEQFNSAVFNKFALWCYTYEVLGHSYNLQLKLCMACFVSCSIYMSVTYCVHYFSEIVWNFKFSCNRTPIKTTPLTPFICPIQPLPGDIPTHVQLKLRSNFP